MHLTCLALHKPSPEKTPVPAGLRSPVLERLHAGRREQLLQVVSDTLIHTCSHTHISVKNKQKTAVGGRGPCSRDEEGGCFYTFSYTILLRQVIKLHSLYGAILSCRNKTFSWPNT